VLLSCAASANLSGFQETVGPHASEYRVDIMTGDAARYMAAGEISLGKDLGGRRIVGSSTETDTKTVVADVESCLKLAAGRGVRANCDTANWRCTTVRPLLDRFDQCLRSRSYAVKECPERCSAPATKKP
jgi:hypothetical protein